MIFPTFMLLVHPLEPPQPPPPEGFILMETGENIVAENGTDYLITE